MTKQPLHITNGFKLKNYLDELKIEGEKMAWQEIICEGPTIKTIHSDDFIELRRNFLSTFYDIDLDLDKVNFALEQLSHVEQYTEVVLWFNYDLFSHINLIAVINLLQQKKIKLPIYLVCSGRIKGIKNLKGLNELSADQLTKHYKDKIKLNVQDIELAETIWGIYGGKDHNLLKPYIVKSSSFQYLSNCLKAHLERFPDSLTGLNVLEKNILNLVKSNDIKSKHHLLGYALNYQGYYGFGDMQLNAIIEKLTIFFTEKNDALVLNKKGIEALLNQHNFSSELNNNMIYGGVNIKDFQFSKAENRLIKTIPNAH